MIGLEPGVVHQRHEAVEDLGHAPAEARRVDVEDPLSLQRPRERPDLGHQVASDDAVVVGERLVPDVDAADHAGPPSESAPTDRPARNV
jgi:hypothetical protein